MGGIGILSLVFSLSPCVLLNLQGKEPYAGGVIAQAKSWARTVKSSAIRNKPPAIRVTKLVGWSPPPRGYWKLNCDGAVSGNTGCASSGGIIRDEEGCWVQGFSRKIGSTFVVQAEWWAILDGMKLLLQLGCRHVIVESDNAPVINMLNSDRVLDSTYSMVRQIWSMASQHFQTTFKHVYRESNQVADYLASWAANSEQKFFILNSPPRGLANLLMKDRTGAVWPRDVAV